MRRALFMVLAASMSCLPMVADAQTVVMRKQIAKMPAGGTGPVANPDAPAAPPTPVLPHSWVVGAWSDADACSNDSIGRRDVGCVRSDGVPAGDAACAGVRPDAQRRGQVLEGCSAKWVPGEWGAYASSCSDATYRERPVACQIEVPGGVNVPAERAKCLMEKPADREGPVASLAGCSYRWEATEWSGWSSHCSEAATRTRAVSCGRSDGTSVDGGLCTDSRPAESEATDLHDACSYSLFDQFEDPKDFVFTSLAGPMHRTSTTRWRPGTYYYAGAYSESGYMFFHPEDGGVAVGVSFVAPRAAKYRFRGEFSGAHVCGDGVGITFGGERRILFQDSLRFDYEKIMSAGDTEPFMVDANNNMSCDSTNTSIEVTSG